MTAAERETVLRAEGYEATAVVSATVWLHPAGGPRVVVAGIPGGAFVEVPDERLAARLQVARLPVTAAETETAEPQPSLDPDDPDGAAVRASLPLLAVMERCLDEIEAAFGADHPTAQDECRPVRAALRGLRAWMDPSLSLDERLAMRRAR